MRFFVTCLASMLLAQSGMCVSAERRPNSDARNAQPLVRFSGGAVEFALPRGWEAAEMPFAREVHLVLSPGRQNTAHPVTTGRIWLSCHASGTLGEGGSELAQVMAKRVAAVTHEHGEIVRTHEVRIAGHAGIAAEFTAKHPDGTLIRGAHVLLETDNGLCELHAVAPTNEYAHVDAATHHVLRTLALRAGGIDPGPIVSQTSEAASALGAWKAVHSRLYLDGRGNIAIELDRSTVLSVAENGSAPVPPRRITGRFSASGDLLYVTWADGSRVNYRWRLSAGDLLLTDHDGNVSQLRRLVH